jgi:hypothetical protein
MARERVAAAVGENQISFESDGIAAGGVHVLRHECAPLVARAQRNYEATIVAIRPERVDGRQLDPLRPELGGSIEKSGEVMSRVPLLATDGQKRYPEEQDQPTAR